MKKMALTSLLAFMAVGGAHAANVIDSNPLYRPGENRFYSITALESHTEAMENWMLVEEFGYGITDKLAVFMKTGLSEVDGFDYMSWNDFSVGLNYRLLDMGAWKGDVYGVYKFSPVWGDHQPFLDEDLTHYTWTLGVRGGYVGEGWTVAGHVDFDYTNSESFNWGDDGLHKLSAGLDAQLLLDLHWNLIAGVEYTGVMNDSAHNAGVWNAKLGANYNLDETKYIGVYIMGEMEHSTGDWEVVDGMGVGVQFGIAF